MSDLKKEKRIIRFSPPDITDLEIEEVARSLKSLVEKAGGIIGTTALEPYRIRTFGKQVC